MLLSTTASVFTLPGMAQGRCRRPRTDLAQAKIGHRPVTLPVEGQGRHLSVLDREEVRGLRRDRADLNPALPASTLVAHEDEDAITVELAELLGDRAEALVGPEHRGPRLSHLRDPLPSSLDQAAGHREVDVRGSPIDRAEIALLPGIEDRLDEVEVGRHPSEYLRFSGPGGPRPGSPRR